MQLEQPSSDSGRKEGVPRSAKAASLNPTQIRWKSTEHWDEHYFGHFVGMKRSQFFLKCRLSILRRLKKDDDFTGRFDFIFPAIDRMNSRNKVSTCDELFGDQRLRDAISRLRIRKSAD